jgi:hypothetical protein
MQISQQWPRSGQQKEKAMLKNQKLDPLPESGDDYWKGAEVKLHRLDPKPECKHQFIQHRNEAECKNCHIGFFLSPEVRVEKGHIYKLMSDSKKLVI